MEKFTFDESIEQVNKEIKNALTRSPKVINEYLTHLSGSRGKMIRATSVLVVNQDEEGLIAEAAIKAAAAIEIIHLASLVHDDVIDNADIRRGEETLQKKYGKRTAVICGDYLLSVALHMVSGIPSDNENTSLSISDYIRRLCLGELLQHVNNWNLELSVFEYIKIISGKTAALFEASFFAGALLGEFSKKESKKYRRIGNYVGLIFQLQDDCLDFDKTVIKAKKPVQSDYEQGVITLPLIYAFDKFPKFKEKAIKGKITRKDINEAVDKSGGIEYTKRIMKRYFEKAKKEINDLNCSEVKKEQMKTILLKSTGKNGIEMDV